MNFRFFAIDSRRACSYGAVDIHQERANEVARRKPRKLQDRDVQRSRRASASRWAVSGRLLRASPALIVILKHPGNLKSLIPGAAVAGDPRATARATRKGEERSVPCARARRCQGRAKDELAGGQTFLIPGEPERLARRAVTWGNRYLRKAGCRSCEVSSHLASVSFPTSRAWARLGEVVCSSLRMRAPLNGEHSCHRPLLDVLRFWRETSMTGI